MTTICALSDTHTQHRQVTLPPADILVFAGDFLNRGFEITDFYDFIAWMREQPHAHKVMIAGNHDRLLDKGHPPFEAAIRDAGIEYLLNSSTEIQGLQFWGSPYTPYFCNWAFNTQRAELPAHWQKMPEGVDVLVTDGPPLGVLDGFEVPILTPDGRPGLMIEHVGDPALLRRVREVKPAVHIFGHIHSGYGCDLQADGRRSFNVAICNEQYKPTNKPQLIEL